MYSVIRHFEKHCKRRRSRRGRRRRGGRGKKGVVIVGNMNEIDKKLGELSKKFSHRLPGQHICYGMLQSQTMPKDVIDKIPSFKMYDTDTIVSGYPKSGTTWLEEIVYLIVHDVDVATCNQVPNYMRVPLLEDSRFMTMIENQAHPRIFKTHMPFHLLPVQTHEKGAKIVYIVRNPKDTAVSMYHFYRSVVELGSFKGSWSEFLEMFEEGYVATGGWFERVLEWWQQRELPNLLIVKYEELIREPSANINQIAVFLGKQLDQKSLQTIVDATSFQSMKTNPMTNFANAHGIEPDISPFMRKGLVGDWKTHFTVAQNERFDAVYNRRMIGTELELDFQ